ncbi:hypothetical protein GCM10027614_79990 [Micromonospora vulcania]
MPTEPRLTFHEGGGHRPGAGRPSQVGVVLGDRDRQGQIGRPEPDTDKVMDWRLATTGKFL